MKRPQLILLPALVLSLLLLGFAWFSPWLLPTWRLYVLAGAAIVTVTLFAVLFALLVRHARMQQQLMDSVFAENAGTAARVIREVAVPCLLCDAAGTIVWRNEIMEKLYDGSDLSRILPNYNFAQPQAAFGVEYAGGAYQIMSMPIRRKSVDRTLIFQYWIDRTEAAHYKRLYEERMPYVALVYVDNLEELSADQQFHRTTVLLEVERLVADTVHEVGGIYRRYDNGRFLLVFEAKQLAKLEESRFALLEAAHRIDTGTSTTVSLSVAVGVSDTIKQSDEGARQAMELALGRGGDQAVVKNGSNYAFYGGKRQLDTMQSRVKARLFAKALRQLFENAGDVVIMGHKNPDMDCIGGALGIAACAKLIGSRVFIVIDQPNASIDLALEQVRRNAAYADCIITPEHAERLMRPSTVLVVVDTQRPVTTIAPQLIDMASRIVLIDHHRRSADYLENTTLHYLESRASSASELITEVLQYFDDAMRPPAFVCSALLAGITVDTKHFAFNVGSRTFEAAGYLRRNGADISMVKQLFQDDMESFTACAQTVEHAELLGHGIALSSIDGYGRGSKLIAAKAADQLIGIRGIEAAFVIGREDGTLYVSGRSLGRINVQLVCEKLGGGGHLTMAGAQLFQTDDMEEAKALVRESIAEYQREANV
ncbi:MAG: DHH family phosphoesterase [bacterium]|nr:DHH family phosphoesterase [bacterium]